MDTETVPIPACDKHGPMTLVEPGTKEQAFCGTWYACQNPRPRCGDSVLLMSRELITQLDEQRTPAGTSQPKGTGR